MGNHVCQTGSLSTYCTPLLILMPAQTPWQLTYQWNPWGQLIQKSIGKSGLKPFVLESTARGNWIHLTENVVLHSPFNQSHLLTFLDMVHRQMVEQTKTCFLWGRAHKHTHKRKQTDLRESRFKKRESLRARALCDPLIPLLRELNKERWATDCWAGLHQHFTTRFTEGGEGGGTLTGSFNTTQRERESKRGL